MMISYLGKCPYLVLHKKKSGGCHVMTTAQQNFALMLLQRAKQEQRELQ